MSFTEVPTRVGGYALEEADWDLVKDNFNTGTWVQLANSTLVSPSSSIDFQSIPGTFAHLMLLAFLRTNTAGGGAEEVGVRFNNDSGSNYDRQAVYGVAAAGSADEDFGVTSPGMFSCPDSTAAATLFGAARIVIPHYANSANHKAMLCRGGRKAGTTSSQMQTTAAAGFWRSTAAITRVTLIGRSGGSFVGGSRVTLYGFA